MTDEELEKVTDKTRPKHTMTWQPQMCDVKESFVVVMRLYDSLIWV